MDIEVLIPEGGPRLDLPFSPGIKFGDLIFVSGQVPFDEKGNIVGQGDVKRQTEQTLRNLEAVLKAGGSNSRLIPPTGFGQLGLDFLPVGQALAGGLDYGGPFRSRCEPQDR